MRYPHQPFPSPELAERFHAAKLQVFRGEHDAAIMELQRLTEECPEHPFPRLRLAKLLFDLQQFDAGFEQLTRVNASTPRMKASCVALKGVALCMRAKHEDEYRVAVETLTEAVELDPVNATLRVWLGNALRGAGRLVDALREYQHSTTIELENENHEWRWTKVGEALRDLGRVEEAQVAFAKAQAAAAELKEYEDSLRADRE